MSFDTNLERDGFLVPACERCNKTAWPPREFCDNCYGLLTMKKCILEGRVIEFSKQDGRNFCIVEFEEGFRVIAEKKEVPKIGQRVKLTKYEITDNGNHFFEIV